MKIDERDATMTPKGFIKQCKGLESLESLVKSTGLKILGLERVVPVQVWPGAPLSTPKNIPQTIEITIGHKPSVLAFFAISHQKSAPQNCLYMDQSSVDNYQSDATMTPLPWLDSS